MTTLRKRRYPILALVLALLVLTTPRASELPLPELPPVTEVVGDSPFPVLACAGCAMAGIGIVLGGWGSILAASMRPGSALVAAGCVATCQRAILR